jgi:hypothetical protein
LRQQLRDPQAGIRLLGDFFHCIAEVIVATVLGGGKRRGVISARHSMRFIWKTRRNESFFFVAGLVFIDITTILKASIEIVPLVLRRSPCASCCWIADHEGGNSLATSTEHFFATSAVTDDSLFVAEATLMQINPANALANFSLANTTPSIGVSPTLYVVAKR